MKKIYALLLIVVFGFVANVNAQTTVFSQNFEAAWTIASTLSPAWSSAGTGDNQWQMNSFTTGWTSTSGAYSPTGANSTTQSARFHSYNAASATTGDIITPNINLSTFSNTKRLQFYYINTSGTDVLNVFLSTDGGTNYGSSLGTFTTAASWTLVNINLGTTTSSTVKFNPHCSPLC